MNKLQVDLGKIVVTPKAMNSMVKQGVLTSTLLQQHVNGDWDNVFNPITMDNEFQVSRLMSSQKTPHGELWVITEFDPQVTTITLPDES